nr:inositol monophosphatase 2-like [Onthophagus taurus]
MSQEKIFEYFKVAVELVKEAGKIVKEAKNFEVERKEEVWDLVTVYDKKVEDILIEKLKGKYPDHDFIGEEETYDKGHLAELTDKPTWIIDPIDGTANFVRKLPMSCISVGLTIQKDLVLGIVLNPFLDQLFTAIKGNGAYLNEKRIFTRKVNRIEQTNYNYELSLARAEKYRDLYLYRLSKIIAKAEGIRSLGSAALGLCYVACGQTDVYQCDGLSPWDAAAGVVIVREAGGFVCDTSEQRLGLEFDVMKPNFMAAPNENVAKEYLKLLKEADEERISKQK